MVSREVLPNQATQVDLHWRTPQCYNKSDNKQFICFLFQAEKKEIKTSRETTSEKKTEPPIKLCHLSINELHTTFVLLPTRCLTLLFDSYLVRLYGLSVPPHQILMHPQTLIALGYKSHSLYGALHCSVQH